MNKLIKVHIPTERNATLLNILFAIKYKERKRLSYILESIDPREAAFALAFLTEDQLHQAIALLNYKIDYQIIQHLDEDFRNELLEKIDNSLKKDSEHFHLIARDKLIYKTLELLIDALQVRDSIRIIQLFESLQSSDAANLIEILKPKQRQVLIDLLGNNFDAEILTYLDSSIVSQLFTKIDPKIMSIYLSELKPQDMIEILEQMDVKQRFAALNSISSLISKDDLRFVKKSLQYKEGTAGRIMSNVIVMPVTSTIQAAYKRYCFYSKESDNNQIIYVYDNNYLPEMKLSGKIYLSDLCRLNQRKQTRIDTLAKYLQSVPCTVSVNTQVNDIVFLIKKYYTVDIPVFTSSYSRIVGIINSEQVIRLFEEVEDKKMMTLGGVSDFDFHASISATVKRRMPTLSAATFFCISSALVIYVFEGTVKMIVALSVVGPMIAGIGGNTASQVMTVTVRALFSGEIIAPNKLEAIGKEVAVCFIFGLCIGSMLFVISYILWGSWLFSTLILICAALNLSIAGLAGSGVPIILSSFNRDPALSSTIMNVITDLCGYGLLFSSAFYFRKELRIQLKEKHHISYLKEQNRPKAIKKK